MLEQLGSLDSLDQLELLECRVPQAVLDRVAQ